MTREDAIEFLIVEQKLSPEHVMELLDALRPLQKVVIMTDKETKENLLLLADALVSIVEHECCNYGFTEEVDLAYSIIGKEDAD